MQSDNRSDPFLRFLLDELFPTRLPYNRRIFTNRSLRLDKAEWIGFDMDYTLALYHPEMERLSFQRTMEKLVAKGYPEELASFEYDASFAIRGLVIDLQRGNILKMDRYRHVSVVYHGFERVNDEERRRIYRKERMIFSKDRFYLLDTLFALPEAYIFAKLVSFLESQARGPLDAERYSQLFHDIRGSIDEAHRDNSIKETIVSDLERYVLRDDKLALTLHKFRSAGKKLFLMTNSYYPYSDRVMSFLLDDELPEYPSWRSYFDVIIVGACKPGFFTDGQPFRRVNRDGTLSDEAVTQLQRGEVYQNGNLQLFEAAIQAREDGILYVGDHIYGDILRSKKSTLWRTAMVVQEMERELSLTEDLAGDFRRLRDLERERVQSAEELDRYHVLQKSLARLLGGGEEEESGRELEPMLDEVRHRVNDLKGRQASLVAAARELEAKIDCAFNERWGKLFSQGVEHSQFGNQVEDYACIYTSRVSNFLHYSPIHFFRSPRDPLPHELELLGAG
ncbi:MAG: HAD-IG family 5'-nucleotidase [Myxococcales bacterium]|nr:HAD-IG family 5'-nucleotidase [Myxococcales bacterium]